MHWRSFQDRQFLGVWSLEKNGQARDVVLTIAKVEGALVKSVEKPKGDRCPIVWFEGVKKPMVLNSTNGRTLESLYGSNIEGWVGKRCTLYAADVRVGGQTVKGLRIRTKRPTAPGESLEDVPVDEATRSAQEAAIGRGRDEDEEREPGSDG